MLIVSHEQDPQTGETRAASLPSSCSTSPPMWSPIRNICPGGKPRRQEQREATSTVGEPSTCSRVVRHIASRYGRSRRNCRHLELASSGDPGAASHADRGRWSDVFRSRQICPKERVAARSRPLLRNTRSGSLNTGLPIQAAGRRRQCKTGRGSRHQPSSKYRRCGALCLAIVQKPGDCGSLHRLAAGRAHCGISRDGGNRVCPDLE